MSNKETGKSYPIYLYPDQVEKIQKEQERRNERRNTSFSEIVQDAIDRYFKETIKCK